MKKISKKIMKFLSVMYKILPFFLGIYCYQPHFEKNGHAHALLDAIYASLKLYGGSTEGGVELDLVLEIARFLALAATFSVLISAFNKMGDLIDWLKLRSSDSTVVYGNSSYAGYIFESLKAGSRIRGGKKFIKNASRYLIMFSNDTQNLEFYHKNYESLKDKNVYIMLEDISRQSIENPLLTVFSVSENCARQYWRDYPVEKSERIAIIGFENVGKNILLYGLQMNLIDPDQHFEYHVYGDGRDFRREHTELDKMMPDKIIFHDDDSYGFADVSEFDRIIVCKSTDESCNISIVSKILASVPISSPLHVYAPNGDIITNLFGTERCVCFGKAEEIATIDNILNERSMKAARKQHEFYYKQYGGTPWEKLDAFLRYSNVSSADYQYVTNRLIEQGVPAEKLAELEHMRWCRYHYIHNWKYGENRDNSKRIHPSLIPFGELSEEEKTKDIEAIRSKIQES